MSEHRWIHADRVGRLWVPETQEQRAERLAEQEAERQALADAGCCDCAKGRTRYREITTGEPASYWPGTYCFRCVMGVPRG